MRDAPHLSRRLVLAGLAGLCGGCRTEQGALALDDFHAADAGDDHTRAFNLAFQAGREQGRGVTCAPGRRYVLTGPVEIRPDARGWTPDLDLAGSTVLLRSEDAGFRRRGIKDGEAVNVASGGIRNGTIDANRITGQNGVRCIFGSNSGGTVDDVIIVNMAGGHGWMRHCYVDGGEPSGTPVFSGSVSGEVDQGRDLKWYGCTDSADLTVGRAGQAVAPGASVALATPVDGPRDSTGCAPLGRTDYWLNRGPRSVTTPASWRTEDRTAAGLSPTGLVRRTVNGVAMEAVQAEFVASGGRRKATGAIAAAGARLIRVRTRGGYYGVAVLGQRGVTLHDVACQDGVRGVAGQFGAANLSIDGLRVSGNTSSAVLLTYGSPGGRLRDIQVDADEKWVGEALINVVLGSGYFRLDGLRTRTPAETPHGQYHVYLGPGCSGSRLANLDLRGDCIKAFVAVESAWRNRPGPAEVYSGDPAYRGMTADDLTDIAITDVRVTVPAETRDTATALALIQTDDGANGAIGLSNVQITRFAAPSPKHARSLSVLQGATGAKPVRDLVLSEVAWRPELVSAPAALIR